MLLSFSNQAVCNEIEFVFGQRLVDETAECSNYHSIGQEEAMAVMSEQCRGMVDADIDNPGSGVVYHHVRQSDQKRAALVSFLMFVMKQSYVFMLIAMMVRPDKSILYGDISILCFLGYIVWMIVIVVVVVVVELIMDVIVVVVVLVMVQVVVLVMEVIVLVIAAVVLVMVVVVVFAKF